MIATTRWMCCAALAAAAVLTQGCGTSCTEELRVAISGVVTDADGAPVTPDVVTVTLDGVVEDCEIRDNEYTCFERDGGEYQLHVEVGAFSYDASFELDHDGCHVTESVEHDIVVP